jgi:hypothetical protein
MNRPASASAAPARAAAARAWPAWLALAFGLVAIALPQSDFFRAIPGDLGDARLNGLLLEHVLRWLRGTDPSLWSPAFFFPFPGALTFSDNHLGSVAVYALLRLGGLDPERAYIGWFTLAYVANFLACHYALRRLGLGAAGSAAGAFVYAFAMPALLQAGHAQLGYRFAVPLAVLALHRLAGEGRPLHLAWLGVWVTLQFYCTIYVGYFLLLLLGAYLVALYLLPADATLRPHRLVAALARAPRDGEFRRSLAVLAACAVALAALFAPYAYYAHLYGFARNPVEIASMLPRPGSYLLADASRLWGGLSQRIGGIPMRHEQQMFVGVAAGLLALVGSGRASAWTRASALALALLVVLTLDLRGHSLYAWLEPLPLANAIRAVSRICLVMLLPLALLAGAGVDRLATARGRGGPLLASLLVALLALESAAFDTARVPLPEWRARLAAVQAQAPSPLAADAIVFVPRQPRVPFYLTELDGMALAQRLDRATLNGYSGNSPPGYGQTADPCDDLLDRLVGYATFTQQGLAGVDALLRRVVPVGAPLHCERPDVLPRRTPVRGALPPARLGQIDLAIAGVTIANAQQLAVEVVLGNRADTPLGSISASNQPVRFSWRFVAAEDTAPGPGWDARSELRQDVPAHGHASQRLRVDAPAAPGRYRLEVSLVQEGVAWFHDHGMAVARSTAVIEVGGDGAIARVQ